MDLRAVVCCVHFHVFIYLSGAVTFNMVCSVDFLFSNQSLVVLSFIFLELRSVYTFAFYKKI